MSFPTSPGPPVGGECDGGCDGVGVAPVLLLLWLMSLLMLLLLSDGGVVAALFGGKSASASFCFEDGDGSGWEALDETFTGAADTAAPGVSSSLFSEGNGVWTLLLVADAALSTEVIERLT